MGINPWTTLVTRPTYLPIDSFSENREDGYALQVASFTIRHMFGRSGVPLPFSSKADQVNFELGSSFGMEA